MATRVNILLAGVHKGVSCCHNLLALGLRGTSYKTKKIKIEMEATLWKVGLPTIKMNFYKEVSKLFAILKPSWNAYLYLERAWAWGLVSADKGGSWGVGSWCKP